VNFSRQIFEKYSYIKFHENPFTGTEFLHADGRTDKQMKYRQADRHDEANSLFRNFANAPRNSYIILIEDIPLCWKSKSETKYLKITVQTGQQRINISILLWQHIAVLLDHQASIQRHEVQTLYITHCRTPYYLEGVYKNIKSIRNCIYILKMAKSMYWY